MREHTPVLLHEVIEFLDPKPGKRFIDATIGMAGHSRELLKAGSQVLALDADPAVIASLKATVGRRGNPSETRPPGLASLAQVGQVASPGTPRNDKLILAQGNFADIGEIALTHRFTDVDGILFDLGLGSHQLDDPQRGFSFQKDGPLDMRYDQKSEVRSRKSETAADIVNFYPEKELTRIFYKYGEEMRFGKRIARSILARRKIGSINTTAELFELIKQALPGQFRFRAGDTARKIFQSLRIELNQELTNLERGLQQAVPLLKGGDGGKDRAGGRLVVISFHSLEDRIVKNFFIKQAKDCVCPPSFPVCRCDARATLRILTKKPMMASAEEVSINPRAHSAKLRAAERIL